MPYSEAIHDNVNRFAVMRFAEDPNLSISDVGREHGETWLELSGSSASRVADVIGALGIEV